MKNYNCDKIEVLHMWIDYSKIADYQVVKEVVVGGLEWIGFSKVDTSKLLCISSQMTSLIDCCSGEYIQCDCDYDEESQIAYCDKLPDEEIEIAGQYGGKLPADSTQGEKISINQRDIFQHVPIIFQKPVKPDSMGVPGFSPFGDVHMSFRIPPRLDARE